MHPFTSAANSKGRLQMPGRRTVNFEPKGGHVGRFGRASTDGISVNINIGLLADIEPDNLPILGVDCPSNLLQAGLHPSSGGLAAAVDLK